MTESTEVTGPVAEVTTPIAVEGEVSTPVARHYTRNALLSTLLDALVAAGKTVSPIDSDDLASIDELHAGGRTATVRLADLLAPSAGDRVLDLGCGVGGASRYLARYFGAQVTGVDQSRDFVDVAQELSARAGLGELTRFERASVTSLPFEKESFDSAVMLHVGMNVEDKAALCAEVSRVLRPGGRFALYDVMRLSVEDELTYPVPWASNSGMSFLEQPAEYHRVLTGAGFDVEHEADLRELALEQAARLHELAADELPALGPHLVIGDRFRVKAENLAKAIGAGLVSPVQLLAVRS
ncbi:class I SAM-dependent methyltransferase [Pseudonocardia spinosispora]|uniref:class I SAM-dependent methyltransferase n=1 Tax=Pseudonocardia spinosispora TaxID=103441 RepID=UPI000426454D|nr:class I SAM-dependent methyltransferase [Pseudonocardia spinosispora]